MSSYGHNCKPMWFFGPTYRLSWVVDRHQRGSRLRFPTRYTRDTEESGAKKFCKKHGIEFVEAKPPKKESDE